MADFNSWNDLEAMIAEEPMLDPSAFDNLRLLDRNGGSGFLNRMVDLFCRRAPELIQQIRAAAQRGDTDSLHRAAHSLKTSSATLGARKLAVLCRQLEARAKTTLFEDREVLMSAIEVEYSKVEQALAGQVEKTPH